MARPEKTPTLKVKRAYDPPSRSDGCRVLVDRVWPRGISKEALRLDHWCKDVAPSTELRKWFGHDPEKWEAFRERYFAELDAHPEALAELVEACRGETVTLVFGAKDADHNNAVALKAYLEAGPRLPTGGARGARRAVTAPVRKARGTSGSASRSKRPRQSRRSSTA